MLEVAILDVRTGIIKSKFSELISLNTKSYLDKLIKLGKKIFLIFPCVGHYEYATSNLKINSLIEPIVDLMNPVIYSTKKVKCI